jgi:hypothetical protein
MRKELALFATIAALFSFITFSAEAMPVSSLKGASADQVIQVSGGCGPHRHRGPYGRCRHD